MDDECSKLTDHPWSHLHIDFTGPFNGSYHLMAVSRFFKQPEILRCKKPITGVVTGFLHKLFARFGVPDSIVSDNATQFTSKEFKVFRKMFEVEHITIAPYYSRSNGQAEWFMDTFKRALKNSMLGPRRQHYNSFYKYIGLHQINEWQKLYLHGK